MSENKHQVKMAAELSFPAAELATEVVAHIGNRGGGKSNGTAVIVEQFLVAGIQVIVLDYVGIWSSLRLARDGKAPSRFQIPVLGGRHGDIGLSTSAGAVVAKALAERHSSAVLDLSAATKGDRCRFATDFAETFFQAKKSHPGPVHLVLEEAQRYVPQRVQPDQARMLGAFEEIAEVGRNFGIGMSLISQRPQKLAKDVLNLADTLFAYRTNGVLERKALGEWVQEKGAGGRQDVAGELPGLKCGQAIVWCPKRQIYGKHSISLKQTYDAGATPLQEREAVKIAPLDLGALEVAMGNAADEAKANDPKALRAEIVRLRAEAQRADRTAAAKTVEVQVVPEEAKEAMVSAIVAVEEILSRLKTCARSLGRNPAKPTIARKSTAVTPTKPSVIAPVGGDPGIGASGLRRMLIALAQRPNGLTNAQLGVRAGVSSKSGTFSTYLSRARSQGWIADRGQVRVITEAGIQALGEFDPLPEGPDLADYWIRELGGGASRMLQALVEAYPRPMTNAELGERAGISHVSGTFSTYLSRMRSLELITGRGELLVSEELV